MNRYPKAESNFTQLLKQSFRLHYLTLKHCIFFIFLLTAVKYIAMIFTLFISNGIAQAGVYIVAGLIMLYLFSAALLSTHEAFMDRSITFSDALLGIKKNSLNIYITFLIYLAVVFVAYAIGEILGYVVTKVLNEYLTTTHGVTLLFSTVLLLICLFVFLFSYPLVVIESKKIQNAFYDSLVLSGKCKFGIVFLFAILIAINLLISPRSLQEYFLSTYHLGVLYDFLVLCVMLPLFINLLLLLINDSKLQLMAEEA